MQVKKTAPAGFLESWSQSKSTRRTTEAQRPEVSRIARERLCGQTDAGLSADSRKSSDAGELAKFPVSPPDLPPRARARSLVDIPNDPADVQHLGRWGLPQSHIGRPKN